MRLSIIASFVLAGGWAVHAAATTEDLRAFLAAHKDRTGVSDGDAEFLDWKANVFTSNSTPAPVIPKAYIIQLKPGSGLVRRGLDEHSIFHKRASAGIDYTTRQEFKNPDLFFGLSIQVKDNANETTIKEIPNVLKVWPVRMIQRPVVSGGPGISSSGFRAARSNLTATAGSGANVNSVHHQTGVDRLHALGIKGKGVKVAIIDTGVDWHHPALGGCFGPGCKISFGKDFIGDSYDETGIPVTDDDPLATCVGGGHGTHVAGTIGMQDPASSPFGLVGVAPEADLGMYRVFGCSGSAPGDVLMLAFEQASADKVDVLSISLGSYLLWEEEDPFQTITSALEAQGTAVVVANGNNGAYAGNPSSPAIGKGVIAVGSVQNSHYPTVYGGKDSRGRSFKYSGDPWPVQAPATGLTVFDLVKIAANTSSPQGCADAAWWAADDAVLDKDNSIIAVPYGGGCSWGRKIFVAQSLGFKYTLVYATAANDIFDQEYNSLDPSPPYYVDGRTLLGGLSLSKPNEYKLYFASDIFESHTQLTAGLMSNFSSWGPTSDTLVIKPQVSAPGGSILSTWPLEGTGYAVLSGTSMATPYVSGALALLKSQFPNASVQKLRKMLQSTADTVPYVYDKSISTSVAQQGGGLINVYDAIHFESSVTPSELNLGDLDQLKPRDITIENNSGRSKTYIISHEPAGETNLLPYLYSSKTQFGVTALPGVYASYATVKFSTTSVTIGAGQSANITVSFQPPTDIDDDFLPVYSGYIKITNNNDQFKVAYLGQPYSRNKADYLDVSSRSGDSLPQMVYFDPDQNFSRHIVRDFGEFDFGLSVPGYGYPYLDWVTLQSSQYFRFDIVPYNTSFVPDFSYGVPDSALPLKYPDLPFSNIGDGADTLTMNICSYGLWNDNGNNNRPTSFLYYLEGVAYSLGKNPIGQLPVGDYRALLRVLRWGGDPKKKESYQSWLSPVIRVKRSL
ncbi:subtilisin-like protease [Rhexocercosporidium sp. MPI-PUGE-AT-0058]|nr:subtilisin-like protease [Rhexocercosporidium sp. MPI-PUGE-AT-0058]